MWGSGAIGRVIRQSIALLAWSCLVSAQYGPMLPTGECAPESSCTMACCRHNAGELSPDCPESQPACHHDPAPSRDCALNNSCTRTTQVETLLPLPNLVLEGISLPQPPESTRQEGTSEPVLELPGFVPHFLRPPLHHPI